MPDRHAQTSRSAPLAGLCFGLVVLTFGTAAAEPPHHHTIPWRADLARAKAEAQARGLPLWIQFTGPWCHSCRRLDSEVFTRPELVATARDRFVPIKLRSDEHEALALGFGLSVLPSTVIVSPRGEVIAKHEGYADLETFRAFLDRSLVRAGLPRLWAGRPAPADRDESASRPSDSAGSSDGLALAGYCPVTLVQGHRLTAGQADLSVQYDGREYRFADASGRDVFLRNPQTFQPVDDGRCPVSQVDRGDSVAGDPHFGVIYRGRLYLCADEPARGRFLKDPETYANADVADQGFCPHCRHAGGLLVRGSSRYSATHAGRRYFFPDTEHLEAFRAAPEKYLR
jgi:YHS domain-containing protein